TSHVMQRDDVPIDANFDTMECFQPGEKLFMVKEEALLSRPSTSAAIQSKEKSIRTSEDSVNSGLDFNSRLIDLIKNRRNLYDGSTPGGRSSSFRAQVWDGLALQLEYQKGGNHLQRKWKQLRDKYVKVRRTRQSSPGINTWPLYNKMSFLEPYLVQRELNRPVSPIDRACIRPRGDLSAKEVVNFNRRVINAVRSHPVLYAKSDPNYRSADQRTAAWKAVLTTLNFPCDVMEMQRYWKSIRDRFIRIRRITNGQMEGSSLKWIHYDDFRWLEPFLEHHQRIRERFALARQAADRERRGLVAVVDEEDGVVVDYEVDREDVQTSLLPDQLLESGVRFDGDTAFAASVISDIRALPLEVQALVRERIELALESGVNSSEMMEKLQLLQPEKRRSVQREEGMVKEERG
ncbi:hypothetical protein PMAYCL1PPCAC_06115, partial [Pristionchus mayeri]